MRSLVAAALLFVSCASWVPDRSPERHFHDAVEDYVRAAQGALEYMHRGYGDPAVKRQIKAIDRDAFVVIQDGRVLAKLESSERRDEMLYERARTLQRLTKQMRAIVEDAP